MFANDTHALNGGSANVLATGFRCATTAATSSGYPTRPRASSPATASVHVRLWRFVIAIEQQREPVQSRRLVTNAQLANADERGSLDFVAPPNPELLDAIMGTLLHRSQDFFSLLVTAVCFVFFLSDDARLLKQSYVIHVVYCCVRASDPFYLRLHSIVDWWNRSLPNSSLTSGLLLLLLLSLLLLLPFSLWSHISKKFPFLCSYYAHNYLCYYRSAQHNSWPLPFRSFFFHTRPFCLKRSGNETSCCFHLREIRSPSQLTKLVRVQLLLPIVVSFPHFLTSSKIFFLKIVLNYWRFLEKALTRRDLWSQSIPSFWSPLIRVAGSWNYYHICKNFL